MKNKEVITVLNNFTKIETLKLGGSITKKLIKNKKALLAQWEIIDETRKKIIEHNTVGEEFNTENADKEFSIVLNEASNVELELFPIDQLEQFNDLTLEQYEILATFTE